jgi:hypothetical protein
MGSRVAYGPTLIHAVVVRHIDVMSATLAPFRSLVAHLRLARHAHVAVGVAIVGDTRNLAGTVRDVALGYCLSSHRCYFLSLFSLASF